MKTLITILQLLPVIIDVVKALETAIPVPGAGKEKLDTILGVVSDVAGNASELIPVITATIARVVSLFNRTGVFAKVA